LPGDYILKKPDWASRRVKGKGNVEGVSTCPVNYEVWRSVIAPPAGSRDEPWLKTKKMIFVHFVPKNKTAIGKQDFIKCCVIKLFNTHTHTPI